MTLRNFIWAGAPAIYQGRRVIVTGIDDLQISVHDGRETFAVHISQLSPDRQHGPVMPGQN